MGDDSQNFLSGIKGTYVYIFKLQVEVMVDEEYVLG